MKESAQIAFSAVRSQADRLGIDQESFERRFHVHVPAEAIPKDGPGAGITMATALASLLSGRPVRHTVGMTGELTAAGRVLPIGGLKQKVLAARRRLTDVVIPERNRADLDDVPEHVREELTLPGDVARRGARHRARARTVGAPARRRMTRCRKCDPVPEEVRRAAGLLEGRWTVSILWASSRARAVSTSSSRRSARFRRAPSRSAWSSSSEQACSSDA